MKNTSSHVPAFASCLLLAFLVAFGLNALIPADVTTWNGRISDYFFKLRQRLHRAPPVHPDLIHVDIDDSSYEALGREAGSRPVVTRLIRLLHQAGCRAQVFDIFLPGATKSDEDADLAAAIKECGSVFLPVVVRPKTDAAGLEKAVRPPTPAPQGVAVVPAAAAWGRTLCVDGLIANLESLDAAAAGVGHITCLPDRDGVYRHYNLLIRDGAGFVPSMSLRVACDLLEVPRARIEVRAGRCLRLPEARTSGGARRDLCVPIGNDGTLPVNYAGYWETSFPHYSLHRLLAAAERPRDWEALRGELNGTVAIVSDVSTRTQDFGATPLEHVYPKSGIHANVLNALMTGALLRHTHPAEKAALALLAGLVALLLAARLKAAGFVPAMAGMIVLIYAGAFGAFCWRGVLIDVFEMTLALGLATVAITAAKYFYAERDRIRLRSRFESYLAPAVLERILRSPSLIDQFQQKTITIVFTDIAGFTPWCSTQTPAMIHQTLNQYFEAMTAIVFQYGGTVDKYIGDGLLVFFGDPLEQPDHALRAVRAAIAMQARARKLQADWRDTRGLNLRIRIGINTGEVVVGNMGSASRLDYTVIGAHVNLTQRLESNAPVGGILLSEATYQQVKDRIRAGLHGTIQAKGIPGDLNVYTVDMEAEITSA